MFERVFQALGVTCLLTLIISLVFASVAAVTGDEAYHTAAYLSLLASLGCVAGGFVALVLNW